MTLSEAIKYILTNASAVYALAGARIYPMVAPEGGGSDFQDTVVFREVDCVSLETHDGLNGYHTARVQVTCWSLTIAGAETLRDACRSGLCAFSGTCGTGGMKVQRVNVGGSMATYDADYALYGAIVDVFVTFEK